MNTPTISRILGLLLMTFSFLLLVPTIVATIYNETTLGSFFLAFAITFSIGVLMWLPYSRGRIDLRTRDGFIVTVMFWVVLSLAGALPFVLIDEVHLSLSDAVFESMSGLTTTGATVMTGLDDLPKSILFYRQLLQWFGGIGIVVIAVAIMPMLGIGGMQLYRTETPGPIKDAKLTPRITETAKALFSIYVLLTVACLLAYWAAGMTFFDAISHSFSTVAIGGFSTHDASMGFFNSPLINSICVIFMILAGMNFGLHFYAWNRKSLGHYFRDPETRMYLSLLVGGTVVVCGFLVISSVYGFGESLNHGLFQTVSIMTTTGFATTNYSAWPAFVPFLLMVLSFFGACAGSTGGGLKIGRMLVLSKQAMRELYRLIHPNAVFHIKLRHRVVSDRVADAIWAFFGAYLASFYGIVMLLLATGLDFQTSWSATAAALNNLGPGLGDVAAHYGDISNPAKWILCFGMLLGRLEIFTLLVLFTPMFWRR